MLSIHWSSKIVYAARETRDYVFRRWHTTFELNGWRSIDAFLDMMSQRAFQRVGVVEIWEPILESSAFVRRDCGLRCAWDWVLIRMKETAREGRIYIFFCPNAHFMSFYFAIAMVVKFLNFCSTLLNFIY